MIEADANEEKILNDKAVNHYPTDHVRFPIMNRSIDRRDYSRISIRTFQAIVPKNDAHYSEGDAVRVGSPYYRTLPVWDLTRSNI